MHIPSTRCLLNNVSEANIIKISDEKILELALNYGKQALLSRQRFIGLLPEVNRRKLYEKKGCSSIVEFGAKFAGLSREQVLRALNLERKFEDKPVLKSLFENGEVSMNKLVRVASIATKENEEILATQTKLLSNRALETFVKDEKLATVENQNGSRKPLFESKSVRVHTLLIAEDVENKLSKLQEKGIDINQLLREFLQKRTEEIETEKQRLSDIAQQKAKDMQASTIGKKPSRYISVAIQNILGKEHGNKCSIATCHNPIDDTHHGQRWSLAQVHDPKQMAPLCEQHHQIAHTLDFSYHEIRRRRGVMSGAAPVAISIA